MERPVFGDPETWDMTVDQYLDNEFLVKERENFNAGGLAGGKSRAKDLIGKPSINVEGKNQYIPRTAKEIADIFNLDNTSATKGCKNALTIINEIDRENINDDIIKLNKTTPLSFIERYCSKLNINNELTKLCKFIATKIEKNNLIPENTPHSISAGIIYFVSQYCNLNISKSTINNISKISEVTINKCFKKLEIHKTVLIPEVILKKYG